MPLHANSPSCVTPSSVKIVPEIVIESLLLSQRMMPGLPPKSLSYASPARLPYACVNFQKLEAEEVAVTLKAVATPVEVANFTFLIVSGCVFASITAPATVIAVPLAESRKSPNESEGELMVGLVTDVPSMLSPYVGSRFLNS